MYRKSLRLPEFLCGIKGEGFGGKSKGRPRKPLAEVYSQGRPVARHFVCACYCIRHAIPNYLKVGVQEALRAVGIATGRERFTLTQGRHEVCRSPVEIWTKSTPQKQEL